MFKLLGINVSKTTQNSSFYSSDANVWPENDAHEIAIEEDIFCKITAVCKRLLYVSMRGLADLKIFYVRVLTRVELLAEIFSV